MVQSTTPWFRFGGTCGVLILGDASRMLLFRATQFSGPVLVIQSTRPRVISDTLILGDLTSYVRDAHGAPVWCQIVARVDGVRQDTRKDYFDPLVRFHVLFLSSMLSGLL